VVTTQTLDSMTGMGTDFDEHVQRALDSLPADIRGAMSNVEVIVEEENAEDPDLFGLYLGIPLVDRDSGYAGALPDRIAIYRRPLEDDFGDDPELLEEEIRITVLHEVAHHFGIDEERLEELGWS
jgi:predicted Zn-dependent protease with MMP-like domain